MVRLSDNIRIYRRLYKWTQLDLANKLNVSRTAITRWENEESRPDLNALIRLCEIFNTNLDTLVGYEVTSKATLSEQHQKIENSDEKTLELLHYLKNNPSMKEALYELSITPYKKRRHLEKIILIILSDILTKLNAINDQEKPS